MTVAKERVQEIVKEFGGSEANSGSSDVQVALLTERINSLTGHMKENTKDYSSRRGLLQLVGRRRRLLDYLRREDPERYRSLIAKLGIRK